METPRRSLNSSVIETPHGRFSSVRRQSMTTSTPTTFVEPKNDDQAELAERRRKNEIEERLSESSKSISSIGTIPFEQLQQHFETCLRLSAENKITAKNVWSMHIIDYLATMLGKTKEDTLRIASASLDASTRVYSLRVDSVYTEVLKIAGDLGRPTQGGEQDADVNESEINLDSNESHIQKQKVRRKKRGNMLANKDSLGGDFEMTEKIDPIFGYLASLGGDAASLDKMFQTILQINSNTVELQLISHETFWKTKTIEAEEAMEVEEHYVEKPMIPNKKDRHVCPQFCEFSITDWSLEDEETRLSQEVDQQLNSSQNNDFAFDMDAEPLPAGDISIHAPRVDDSSSDDEPIEEENLAVGFQGRVEQIVDMQPNRMSVSQNLEYSYNAMFKSIWAGPAHWKIKSIVRRPKLRQTNEQQVPVTQKRKKRRETKVQDLDFTDNHTLTNAKINNSILMPYMVQGNYRLKRETNSGWNSSKNLLPDDLHLTLTEKLRLMNNGAFIIGIPVRATSPHSNLDETIANYDYNNPNDSNFCRGLNVDDELADGDHGDGVAHDSDGVNDDNPDIMEYENAEPFIGDNLVTAPSAVPKTFVPYATRAKKIDIKKIKFAMWKILTKNDNVLETEKENNSNANEVDKVGETNFSELYAKLLERVSSEIKASLSCPIVFFGLLHLANEHTLCIEGKNDSSDLIIKKG